MMVSTTSLLLLMDRTRYTGTTAMGHFRMSQNRPVYWTRRSAGALVVLLSITTATVTSTYLSLTISSLISHTHESPARTATANGKAFPYTVVHGDCPFRGTRFIALM